MGTFNIGTWTTNTMDVTLTKPYDAEVKWLESTGSQYIDTGVSAYNAVVGTEIKFQSTTTQHDKWVFGIFNGSLGNSYNYLIGSYGGWNVFLGSAGQLKPGYSVDTNEHIVRINIDGKTQFDNVVLLNSPTSMTYTGDFSSSLWVFMTHRTGNGGPYNNYYMTSKVFYCKIYRDGVLVRDFIPVRFTNELNQSEGAMYDKVSGQLFRNQGTGSFLWEDKQ